MAAQNTLPFAGGAFAAIAAIGYLGMRLIRQESRATKTYWTMAQYELAVSKRDAQVCNVRVSMLITATRRAGIEIPEDIWTTPEIQVPPVVRPEGI